MTTHTDPDLQRLSNLLSFLPGPDDPNFWKEVAEKDRPPSDPSYSDYVIKNLVGNMPALHKPDPQPREIAKLVQYLLMFFGGNSDRLHDPIGRRFSFVAGSWETLGQVWQEDLTATCWRLYVRYAAVESWWTKWPEDVQAWREGRYGDASE
ncbi:hypothetical protein [Streptosporangium sp. NPDC002524]|uniref:hypothetical protein n=1 Tax=Streptosporangium sp. NPDC002524 TaxID=3154537 RepID=UPI00333159BF